MSDEVEEQDEATLARSQQELARARTHLATVTEVADVHPHLRRVTVAGPDLDGFQPLGPDTFCYLLVPPAGQARLPVDHDFSWERFFDTPEPQRPGGAYYTVRCWRPEARALDLLMVLHGDQGSGSAWAGRARPGDPVALWGPRSAYHPPPDTRHVVLVADDTALPAAAAIVEQLPDGVGATVLAEVAAPDEHQPLPHRDGVEVTWLHRGGAAPGTTTLLCDAVRALPPFGPGTYVWGGGESRAMTAVRRHVRRERGLPLSSVSLLAYWRRTDHA